MEFKVAQSVREEEGLSLYCMSFKNQACDIRYSQRGPGSTDFTTGNSKGGADDEAKLLNKFCRRTR